VVGELPVDARNTVDLGHLDCSSLTRIWIVLAEPVERDQVFIASASDRSTGSSDAQMEMPVVLFLCGGLRTHGGVRNPEKLSHMAGNRPSSMRIATTMSISPLKRRIVPVAIDLCRLQGR
jgi:hypothetical protein